MFFHEDGVAWLEEEGNDLVPCVGVAGVEQDLVVGGVERSKNLEGEFVEERYEGGVAGDLTCERRLWEPDRMSTVEYGGNESR